MKCSQCSFCLIRSNFYILVPCSLFLVHLFLCSPVHLFFGFLFLEFYLFLVSCFLYLFFPIVRTFALIAITVAFCSMQAGRIAGYYLCKLQSITTQEIGCDCNKFLTDKHAQHHSGMTHLQEKPSDHVTTFIAIQFDPLDLERIQRTIIQDRSLEKGFVTDLIKPPSFRFHIAN